MQNILVVSFSNDLKDHCINFQSLRRFPSQTPPTASNRPRDTWGNAFGMSVMLHLFKMPTDQRPSGTTKTSFQQYRLWSTSRFQKPAPCKFLGLQVQNESNRILVALLLPILLVHLCDLFQTLLLCFETDHPLDSVLHWLLWAKIVYYLEKNPNPTKHMGCFYLSFFLKLKKQPE